MSPTIGLLSGLLLPAVLVIFLGLYVLGLLSGVEPELALFRSGLAGVVLALLGRVAIGVLDAAPPPREPSPTGSRLDVAIDDDLSTNPSNRET